MLRYMLRDVWSRLLAGLAVVWHALTALLGGSGAAPSATPPKRRKQRRKPTAAAESVPPGASPAAAGTVTGAVAVRDAVALSGAAAEATPPLGPPPPPAPASSESESEEEEEEEDGQAAVAAWLPRSAYLAQGQPWIGGGSGGEAWATVVKSRPKKPQGGVGSAAGKVGAAPSAAQRRTRGELRRCERPECGAEGRGFRKCGNCGQVA